MKLHRSLSARLILVWLGILAITASSALGAVPGLVGQPETPALVRVDLDGSASLKRLAATGLPVYAHLHSQAGLEYVLLPADSAERERLADLGFEVKVLDEDSRTAEYYLLQARQPDSLSQVGDSVRVLEQDGLAALVRAEARAAEALAQAGIEIVRLQLHMLVVPEPQLNALPAAITPDPTIQEMIDRVLAGSVNQLDGGLSGEWAVNIGGELYSILTRYSRTTTPIEKATQYGYERFASLGLNTDFHYYDLPGSGTRRNVVAEQPGLTQPERIFLITAHLDSTSGDSDNYAPGADDNASGSTGVLIAANILSDYNFDCTLRYALFTGEEQGLIGSEAYAQDAYENGDNIEGVLNLDMIAYNSENSPPVIELHTRPGNADDLAIANLFVDVISAYGLNLTPQIVQDGELRSDHYSFWQFGYPAILGIEDFQDFTPYYHTTGDQLETLDPAYFTNFVKASVGTMVHMGCLNKGFLAGHLTDIETNSPVANGDLAIVRSSGEQLSMVSDQDGDYVLGLATGMYTITAQADGYLPFSTSGIAISTDITTTLDIALQPCHLTAPDFSFSPPDPLSGQPVTFTATLGIPSTLPVTYTWDFGDGHGGSGQVAEHTYTLGGTYPVTLSVENCAGSLAATRPVSVESVPGINLSAQSFNLEAAYGQVLTQTLEIGNSGETPLTWSLVEQPDTPWLAESIAAGELNPQQRQEITLTFQAPLAHGVYNTTLQVLSDDPEQPQTELPVTLQVVCGTITSVDFSNSPAEPRIGENVTFTSQVEASQPVTYTWSFQDGSPDQSGEGLASVAHAFPVAPDDQIYIVALSAQNACSEPMLVEKNVIVSAFKAFLPILQVSAP